MHNVPVETLRRRATGLVSLNCRPGPPPVLTTEEEARLAQYCVAMADMGFGLTREGVIYGGPGGHALCQWLSRITPVLTPPTVARHSALSVTPPCWP